MRKGALLNKSAASGINEGFGGNSICWILICRSSSNPFFRQIASAANYRSFPAMNRAAGLVKSALIFPEHREWEITNSLKCEIGHVSTSTMTIFVQKKPYKIKQ